MSFCPQMLSQFWLCILVGQSIATTTLNEITYQIFQSLRIRSVNVVNSMFTRKVWLSGQHEVPTYAHTAHVEGTAKSTPFNSR